MQVSWIKVQRFAGTQDDMVEEQTCHDRWVIGVASIQTRDPHCMWRIMLCTCFDYVSEKYANFFCPAEYVVQEMIEVVVGQQTRQD